MTSCRCRIQFSSNAKKQQTAVTMTNSVCRDHWNQRRLGAEVMGSILFAQSDPPGNKRGQSDEQYPHSRPYQGTR
jgi:hypothetical protein